MTPEQWQQVELALAGAYGAADLVIDGYDIALRVERAKGLSYTIVVYVNGCWKVEWLSKDCEERRRFFRPVHTCFMSRKQYEGWRKACGKKEADAQLEKAKATYWLPDWPSFRALKRHLTKNNASIALKDAP